jgi:hypothetical protein
VRSRVQERPTWFTIQRVDGSVSFEEERLLRDATEAVSGESCLS